MAERIIDWLSGRRVSISLDLIQQHSLKVEETVGDLAKALESSTKGKYEEALHSIHHTNLFEEDADTLRRRLVEELAKADIDVKAREDLVHLMRRSDIIADWAKDAAWNLEALIKMKINVPDDIFKMLEEIGQNLTKQVKALRECIVFLKKDPDATLAKHEEVEEFEHKVDELYHNTKMLFFNLPKNFDIASFMVLRDLLKDLEQVADFCDDAANIVRSIAVRLKGPPR